MKTLQIENKMKSIGRDVIVIVLRSSISSHIPDLDARIASNCVHSSIPRWTNEDKYPPVWPETGLSNLPELCSGGEAPPHPAGVEGGLSTGKHREERQDKQQNRLVVTNWILETYAILCNHEHTTEK